MSLDVEYVVSTPESFLRGRPEGSLAKDTPPRPVTVLIVDDDASVRAGIRRLLQHFGYATLEAEHGAEALQLLRDSFLPVDVVLTDVVMPEMTGIELVQQLSVEFPTLPVIYLSAYVSHPAVRQRIGNAERWALAKPVSTPVLMAALESALAERVPADRVPAPRLQAP